MLQNRRGRGPPERPTSPKSGDAGADQRTALAKRMLTIQGATRKAAAIIVDIAAPLGSLRLPPQSVRMEHWGPGRSAAKRIERATAAPSDAADPGGRLRCR